MSSATDRKTLRFLDSVQPLYVLPEDPLVDEVLVPAFQNANHVDCMVGFFHSGAIASLAPGLATYINTTPNRFRLIISPFLSEEDRNAIEAGVKSPSSVASEFLEELLITDDLIQQHVLKCLSYLLRVGRIEMRIALMKDALFHPKVWLFHAADDIVAAHGSSNATVSGIKKNIEQIAVSHSWRDQHQGYITDKLCSQFRRLWDDRDHNCTVVPVPRAVRERLLHTYSVSKPPSEEDLRSLYRRAKKDIDGTSTTDDPRLGRRKFAVPTSLRYQDGPFQHQGRAVHAWCSARYRGILEMATGSGKTIAAMICAHQLHEAHSPLLIVVAAPYVPLVQQWCDEIAPFGLSAFDLTVRTDPRSRTRTLSTIRRSLQTGSSDVEAVVVSHDTLCDSAFQASIQKCNCATLLVADEVHNLGRQQFIAAPPAFFDYRLGLSATPVRQYDEVGSAAISAFFGPVVFRFSLKEAIGHCLVEYDYHVHRTHLTRSEMDKWFTITARIRANAWRLEDKGEDDEYVKKLLRDRRAILENAEGKLAALDAILREQNARTLTHTLIYASDKAPHQLEQVNALLRAQDVSFHQLTHEETVSRRKTARIIQSFQEGTIGILTAKRVLDEGLNIPQISRAFILASTTVERQWVQRRGRLLRKCSDTGKTHSEIHDFLALPPELRKLDREGRSIVRAELTRIQEFARLARNAGDPDGPLSTIRELVNLAFGSGDETSAS